MIQRFKNSKHTCAFWMIQRFKDSTPRDGFWMFLNDSRPVNGYSKSLNIENIQSIRSIQTPGACFEWLKNSEIQKNSEIWKISEKKCYLTVMSEYNAKLLRHNLKIWKFSSIRTGGLFDTRTVPLRKFYKYSRPVKVLGRYSRQPWLPVGGWG